ncbi:hypothetical protein [Saccharopolyspora sp. 5N708]|uniref:hypothetical protein n=1 Tax=Saccharopolyspora sp. 5N708 TaxID=3457424 RepID=UPI003FCF161B
MRLRQAREEAVDAVECWSFSFGEVQEFFARTPCRNLRRVQFQVSDEGGNTMSVLVSQVQMATAADARKFRRLIDEHDTGDILPVLADVRFTGHHYDSQANGKTITIAETEAVSGNPSKELLEATAEAATALAPR